MIDHLRDRYGTSHRRACRLLAVPRSVYDYRSRRDPLTLLRQRMREIAATRVRYGYRKVIVLLRREGFPGGKHMLYRIYREEGLALRYRPRRVSRAQTTRPERPRVRRPNAAWSIDFVSDQLADGARFRILTVVDVFTRECLATNVGQNLGAAEVVTVLESIRKVRGAPARLLCDNGSEFTSQLLDLWAYQHSVTIDFSRPGKPTDNAFVESFNGTLRDECLNAHWFTSLGDATMRVEAWRRDYNESRPHRALGEIAPAEFARQFRLSRDLACGKGADD